MILHAPALHLLIAASITASPPIDPSSCAASDLRCTGRANTEAAQLATTTEQKVKHLYRAHRAYLALADEGSQQAQDLCRARELIKQARDLPATPIHARVVASEAETEAKFKAAGIECPRRRDGRFKPARTTVATTTTPSEPPPLLPIIPKQAPNKVASHELETPTPETAERRVAPPDLPATSATSPPAERPTDKTPTPNSPIQRQWSPRAWAGLGTMVLGAGLVAGMTGSLRGRRAANDTILDIDRQVEAENRVLTVEETEQVSQANLRWQRLSVVAVVTGTVGAAALLTGAVLMATGLRRRVNVSPWGDRTSAGLLLLGRF